MVKSFNTSPERVAVLQPLRNQVVSEELQTIRKTGQVYKAIESVTFVGLVMTDSLLFQLRSILSIFAVHFLGRFLQMYHRA